MIRAVCLFLVSASVVAVPVKGEMKGFLSNYQKMVFEDAEFGSWKAYAYRDSEERYQANFVSCVLQSDGAQLVQTRPKESGRMTADWTFYLNDWRLPIRYFEWIEVKGQRYEVEHIPWRLVFVKKAEEKSGVSRGRTGTLAFGRSMFAIRKNENDQWLPFEYLTDNILKAKSITIAYRAGQGNPTGNVERITYKMSGFKEGSKWCGKQILVDQLGSQKVRDLVE